MISINIKYISLLYYYYNLSISLYYIIYTSGQSPPLYNMYKPIWTTLTDVYQQVKQIRLIQMRRIVFFTIPLMWSLTFRDGREFYFALFI